MAALPEPVPPAPELTPTGRVILGMIAAGKRTGYEIKQLVDKSTRHFWAASYGQIYPELKRLESQGLVTGRAEPTGGRARMVYELTPEGEAALQSWLRSDEEPLYELRDEGMLKLFFSDLASGQRVETIRAIRDRQRRKLSQLQTLEPLIDSMRPGPALTLRLGVGLTKWLIDWCETTERQFREEDR